VLQQAHVQLDGDVDELLEQHRTLIGPRGTEAAALPADARVIKASRTERQSTLLARLPGGEPELPEGWRTLTVNLEDLVLAYLTAGNDSRSGNAQELAAK